MLPAREARLGLGESEALLDKSMGTVYFKNNVTGATSIRFSKKGMRPPALPNRGPLRRAGRALHLWL